MTDARRDKTNEFVATFLKRLNVVRPAIVNDIAAHGATKLFYQSKISCPICNEGDVYYTYHGHYNGHIQAKCSTEGCVSWVE